MTPELAALIAMATAFITGGVSYGATRANVAALKERIERIESEKASRESVTNVSKRLDEFREHIDQRFNVLEVLLRNRDDTNPGIPRR